MNSFALTDVGSVREMNQDYVFNSDEAVGILPNLYIVADGMGGHNAGDYASRFCVTEFVKEIKANPLLTEIGTMDSAINSVNNRLIAVAAEAPELNGMGTTFVACVVEKDTAIVMNIGDSRLYLFSAETGLRQITQDHSLVETLIKSGELDRRNAVHHPKKNVITRAMGVEASAVPDFFEIDITPGDKILLCSDGLTNMVNDETIESMIDAGGSDISNTAKQLVDLANEKGGKDNISVVLVEV